MSSDFPIIGVILKVEIVELRQVRLVMPVMPVQCVPVRSLRFPHWTRSPLWDAAVCSLLATLPWWGACQHLEAYQVMGWWSRIVMRCVHGHWLPKRAPKVVSIDITLDLARPSFLLVMIVWYNSRSCTFEPMWEFCSNFELWRHLMPKQYLKPETFWLAHIYRII